MTSLVGLNPGSYSITARVLDSDEQAAAHTITFRVGYLETYLPLILKGN